MLSSSFVDLSKYTPKGIAKYSRDSLENIIFGQYSLLDDYRRSNSWHNTSHVDDRVVSYNSFYQKKAIFYGDYAQIYDYKQVQSSYYVKRLNYSKDMTSKRRSDSYNRSRQTLYKLLACNVAQYSEKPVFWTFTFDPEIVSDCNDLKTANSYFSAFIKEFRRLSKLDIKYICVPEFQRNGNVHYHCVFFNIPFIEQSPFIFNKFPDLLDLKVFKFSMSDLWPWGSTKAISLEGVDNISAYISKYMSKSFMPNNVQVQVYGQKLYFCSRGLKKPWITYDEVLIDSVLKSGKIEVVAVTKLYFRLLKIIIIKHIQNYGEHKLVLVRDS